MPQEVWDALREFKRLNYNELQREVLLQHGLVQWTHGGGYRERPKCVLTARAKRLSEDL